MTIIEPALSGLVPDDLKVRSARILLESLAVQADIGLNDLGAPEGDDPAGAWNYDFLRREVAEIAGSRRWNLQETLAHAIFERVAAFRGIRALRIRLSKPDVYPDAHGVGVEIASFAELWPEV
jgi:dihydroneopterin aldolase